MGTSGADYDAGKSAAWLADMHCIALMATRGPWPAHHDTRDLQQTSAAPPKELTIPCMTSRPA